jgi:hypothetical protein
MQATRKRSRVGVLAGAGVAGVVALALVVLGAFALAVDGERDSTGYISSGTTRYDAPGYALATKGFDLGALGDVAVPAKVLGDVRVQVHSDKPVFVGIARASEVDRYLNGVGHTTVTGTNKDSVHDYSGGAVTPADPTTAGFWVASGTAGGVQNLQWRAHPGRWRAVVMNADGSRDVRAGMAIGAEAPNLERDGFLALAAGVVLVAGVALAVRIGTRD